MPINDDDPTLPVSTSDHFSPSSQSFEEQIAPIVIALLDAYEEQKQVEAAATQAAKQLQATNVFKAEHLAEIEQIYTAKQALSSVNARVSKLESEIERALPPSLLELLEDGTKKYVAYANGTRYYIRSRDTHGLLHFTTPVCIERPSANEE